MSASLLPPRVEVSGNVITRAEVHFVRSLTVKRRVRELRVVLGDVVVDEAAEGPHGVELIQEEPLVLQCPPPRLDHRVGTRDLRTTFGELSRDQSLAVERGTPFLTASSMSPVWWTISRKRWS